MSWMNNIKSMMGFDEPDFSYQNLDPKPKEQELVEPVTPVVEEPAPRHRRSSLFTYKPESSNVIDLHGNKSTSEVLVINPRRFEEMPAVVQELRERKSIVINLTTMETDQAQRCVDFIAGATYSIDGHMERIADCIFMFAPSCVKLTPRNTVTDSEVPSQPVKNNVRTATSWTGDAVSSRLG